MILVTGGAGFIGSNFTRMWTARQKEPVINVDKLTYAGNMLNISDILDEEDHIFVKADISDRRKILSLLSNNKVRAIINFAAETHVDRSIIGPAEFIKTNIFGTFSLLEAALAYFKNLPENERQVFRFLQISTDEVYGSLEEKSAAFTELSRYEPNSPYSASKASADFLVRAYNMTYGLPTLTTNCSNNYGPYQFPEKLIPLIIHNALSDKPLPLYGDGKHIRDWLYVKDHCRAILRVLKRGQVGEVYNVGGWNEMSNYDVVLTICATLDRERPRADGKPYSHQISFVKDRPGHDRRYAMDARKIERELGWKPKESFESGILKTVRWYLDNQAWVEQTTTGKYREWVDQHYSQ